MTIAGKLLEQTKTIAIYLLLATVAALSAVAWFSTQRASVAIGQRDLVASQLRDTSDAITKQRREARAQLDAANASVLAQQKRLDAAYLFQEKTDGTNTKAIAQLRADLLRMRAAARGVLDGAEHAGRGVGSGAEQGGSAADTGSSFGHRAQANRLFPATADEEADNDAFDADTLNAAYSSCRTEAFSIRAESR